MTGVLMLSRIQVFGTFDQLSDVMLLQMAWIGSLEVNLYDCKYGALVEIGISSDMPLIHEGIESPVKKPITSLVNELQLKSTSCIEYLSYVHQQEHLPRR